MCCYTPYQSVKLRLAHSLGTFQSLLEIVIMKVGSHMATLLKKVGELHIA